MPFVEAVVDNYVVAVFDQLFSDDAADIARAAGHENTHDVKSRTVA
jgi:hypothetical protein